jgi:Uncharacterized protein conserved in bacteria (DUF2252)
MLKSPFAFLRGSAIVMAADLATTSITDISDTFDNAIADFAVAYANQTECDHQALIAAVKSGRILAIEES